MSTLADRIDRAHGRLEGLQVAVLPDFFLDHFVSLGDWRSFQERAVAIHARGGGNLLTGPQSFRLGGNAANTAYALGRLGVPTTLITKTDPFGAQLIRTTLEGLPVDTSCVQTSGRTGSTVALEFHDDGSNVMLSYPGALVDLGPDDLDVHDGRAWRAIERADAVAITNWSQTLEHGSVLLEAVAKRAREHDAFTFLDTGDPTHRGQAAARLMQDGTALRHVSAWGMNENELSFFARIAGGDSTDPVEAARSIRRVFPGRLDVHTWSSVFSLDADGTARCGTYVLEPLRLTGSGDAWNAGNLLGQLLDVAPTERLALANAVAALTITAEDGLPPDMATLVRFLRHRPFAERPC